MIVVVVLMTQLPRVGVAKARPEQGPHADHDAQAPRKTSADPTNSELRRANFRNCSCMSSMRRTGGATRYGIRLGAFLHSV